MLFMLHHSHLQSEASWLVCFVSFSCWANMDRLSWWNNWFLCSGRQQTGEALLWDHSRRSPRVCRAGGCCKTHLPQNERYFVTHTHTKISVLQRNSKPIDYLLLSQKRLSRLSALTSPRRLSLSHLSLHMLRSVLWGRPHHNPLHRSRLFVKPLGKVSPLLCAGRQLKLQASMYWGWSTSLLLLCWPIT